MMPQAVPLAFEAFEDAGSGRPLLILHGFFASSRNWRSIARQLAATRPVFVLDMRNHGASPHAASMDYPSMAADVLAFMDARGMASADVLGHSMGGKVAMWLALQQPQRVGQLLIADISPVAYSHRFDNTVLALKALPLAQLSNRKQAEEHLASAIADLHYRQFLLQNLVLENGHYRWRVDLDIFHRNAPFIVGFPDTSACLPYTKPVLFLSGEQSTYIQPYAIHALFPAAVIEVIAGTGHWLHAEAPQAFCAAVEQWLA
jgi:esterase